MNYLQKCVLCNQGDSESRLVREQAVELSRRPGDDGGASVDPQGCRVYRFSEISVFSGDGWRPLSEPRTDPNNHSA